jgi:thiamine transport system permease protein
MRRRWWVGLLLVGGPLAFLALTYGWPLVALGRRTQGPQGWSVVGDVLADPRILRIAWRTVVQAVVSTGLAVVLGVPAAYCHARFSFPGRRLVWLGVAVPFVLPTVVVASALLGVAPPGRGALGSWAAIVVAHVIVNLAVVVRTVAVRIESVDPHLEEAARTTGRTRWAAATLAVGASRDAVLGAALVVFLFTLTSFGIVAVLGGGSVTTIEIEIWFQTTQVLRLDVAAVLSLVQMLLVAGVLVLHHRSVVTRSVASARPRPARRRPTGRAERAVVAATALVQVAAVGVPVGVLAVRSLRVGDGWGLDHYRHLGSALGGTGLAVTPLRAVGTSLVIGLVAAAVALAVGVPAAAAVATRRRGAGWLDAALMLPLATSAATVGFGILVAYREPPFDLRGSALAIPLVEATIAAPLVARSLAPVFSSVDRRQLEAARLLGAGPARRLATIVAPVVRPAIGVSAALAFAVSLGEFGATAFLARTGSPTIPQVIVRLLGRPGAANLGQAMAMGCVLVVVCGGVFALAEALGRGRALEF